MTALDLSELTRERADPALRPPRRWLRFAVPLALLAGFLAVLASSAGDLLRGAKPVTIVRPEPATGALAARAAAGSVVAQAAGWVEPDPFPIRATALAEGVVAELLVQESDVVERGALLALLVDDDARLALEEAAALRAELEGELRAAEAELEAARAAFEAPTALREAAAVAEARADGRRAESEHRAQAVAKGDAQVALAADEVLVQAELEASGVAGPRQVEIAEARLAEARGELAILRAGAALAAAEERVAAAQLERARRDLELRIEDTARLAQAEARREQANAALERARVGWARAQLRLERMRVLAPAAGVVLERLATVGSALAGADSAVATLYDPASIRVRVDVPQQDLGKLFVGQRAEVQSDARRGRAYAGEVARVVRLADIQKVTLQAHVRVLDGDELLRPEMLVQVRFLAPEPEAGAAAPESVDASRVAIPARLVLAGGRVWIVDAASGRAVLREVEVAAREGEMVVVASGLDLSTRLIDGGREGLEPGDRIAPQETP